MDPELRFKMAAQTGIEPVTSRLTADRSAAELLCNKEAEGLEPPNLNGQLFSRQRPHPAGLLPLVFRWYQIR